MDHKTLENQINQASRRRRIIIFVIIAIFLIITAVFSVLYAQSKTVTTIESVFGTYESVSYNYSYSFGILAGVMGALIASIILFFDFATVKITTFEINGYHVSYSIALSYHALYVNGNEVTTTLNTIHPYHLDTALPDGTQINVAIGKWSSLITFSDARPPIKISAF